jgi:hypothetical protein
VLNNIDSVPLIDESTPDDDLASVVAASVALVNPFIASIAGVAIGTSLRYCKIQEYVFRIW